MKVFVGMETSGVVRRAFQARGHYVVSCDLLPADDGANEYQGHWQGDVFDVLERLAVKGVAFDLAIFHPDCTYHAVSGAWAFSDGPYHQKVQAGTLVGAARREAREQAEGDVRRLAALPIPRKAIENPIGTLSTRVLGPPTQVVQPYEFGEDASKATCLWLFGELPKLRPTAYVEPRLVAGRPRWANQSDGGQNKLTPGPDRWKERARTYAGIAAAMAAQWG